MSGRELLEMAKKCFEEKLFAGTTGNLSTFDRKTGLMLITPTSLPYDIMKEEDLVRVKIEDGTHMGLHRPSSEWRLHAAIYREIEGAEAIVHTHSPYATSFAVTHQPIPLLLNEMAMFLGGEVPVAPIAVPGTEQVGTSAVEALKGSGCYAALLANHGVVTYGKSLTEAHDRACYVEDAAKVACLAMSHGMIQAIPESLAELMKPQK